MNASSSGHPLQADKPKVIILGDGIVDQHIYDMRADDADKSQAWTSPLSRDDWHYAAGFETRPCLVGATAIHVMLWANDIPVASNIFPIKDAFPKPETGSIFVFRRRLNAGETKEARTCTYLVNSPDRTWQEIAALSSIAAKPSAERDSTWRARVSLLSKSGLTYVDPFDGAKHNYEKSALHAVCLWDAKRGFFTGNGPQQDALFEWYRALCTDTQSPPILIRTSEPDRFKGFLEKLARELNQTPTVVLVCALAELDDGDLRGAGTWSDVWSQAYDYLSQKEKGYLLDSTGDNWKFHVVIPVYEDGAIWIGPNCWAIDDTDRNDETFLGDDKRPIGKLFIVPGMQPGLSEFEEHGRIIGAHALLTYALIEHLVDAPNDKELAPAIKKGLMRCKRLRSHGYCAPDELFSVKDSGKTFYVNYPCAVWKRNQRQATDILIEIKDQNTGQHAGPYEVNCKVDFPADSDARAPARLRVFRTMEKLISNEFVASPPNCNRVVADVGPDKDILDRFKKKKRTGKPDEDWIEINSTLCPVDSFAREEIGSFGLRQRISMQFGNFAMANPRDAAPILDLAQRIRQHVNNRYNSPGKGSVFNFALFGSPGSGKSFLAREIARLIDSKKSIFDVDEINLSQFTDPAQLTRALEMVASKSVAGKVPLVLWDEFDSVIDEQRGGWLARFLMPMQDAHFFDGHEKRPIGTAVFAFIGGTFATAADFRAWACRTTGPNEPPSEAVLLKARDFHSRLYTALNMPSIVEHDEHANPNTGLPSQVFRNHWKNSYARLARAVLLREYFRRNSKIGKTVFLKRVEGDLSKFLLAIPLRHGARSLQRIVEACLVSKPSRVSMLHLPPTHFLAEHIETDNVRRAGSDETGMTIKEMLDACKG